MAGQNQGGGLNSNNNTNQFEVYFQRADSDRDGKISGGEAVVFFQGSNLSKQVLAQIWMHADQSHTGYLGRQEFYNALKLVTVAQSKRELTPDIVKAALYGPASDKIPAPQINLALTPAPQSNLSAAAPAPQMGAVALTGAQNLGSRGQVTSTASMNQQYFPSPINQSMRPPVPMVAGSALRPPQGVGGSDFPRGGSMMNPGLPNSNMSSDWLGGRIGGASTAGTSQVLNSGISPSIPSVSPKPQDPLSTSSSMAAKDFKASIGSGNAFSSDQMFGGDVFSAATLPKLTSSAPTYSASSAPVSSAIFPATSGPQYSVNPDPFESLQSSYTRQSTGVQLQLTQSLSKPNPQVSAQSTYVLSSSGVTIEAGNSASNKSQHPWPKMNRTGVQKYMKVFLEVDTDRDGKITGEQARNLFLSWRLPRETLKQVWDLSDQDNDSMLSLREFCLALYLMERYREGHPLAPTLPSSVLLDETLLSLAGPPNVSYGSAGWVPAPGLRPQQGMAGTQPMASTGLRPPTQMMFTQADGSMQFNEQKAGVPSMETSHVNQLSNGGQNLLDSKDEEAAETDKKVEAKEKVLLDSKEKLEFYRAKMQDLVLYKSRCDNRLNEILERALSDKREAEILTKKYEEKYKQVAEIASKLTIEEASFRDVQERKMELHQAIVKMEQGGSTDGILQVRADRIQSDLEELLRALTERCKKHGVHVKSTALIEIPRGWQPGVSEISAVWDEEWDKFEDEGFSFDVPAPAHTKFISLQNENSSPNDILSPDSTSNADNQSEKLFSQGERGLGSESAYTHSEDESPKNPLGSPARSAAYESPSKEYLDNHFRKNYEADTEIHRSFDEQGWGTFDSNDDTDSVWGFSNAKDSDNWKQGGKYFPESSDFGRSPIRTESPHSGGMFQKKSPFFEDSVPSTPLSRAGNSPTRYSMGSGDHFFDNVSRYDSFSTHDHGFSQGQETFTRFDSVNSARGFDHSRGFSFDDSEPFGSSGSFMVSSSSESSSNKRF